MVGFLPGPTSAAEPAERPIVALELPRRTGHSEKQILVREVIRQAFLIAARDDFQARTRDPLLRESFPAEGTSSTHFHLDIDLPEGKPVTIKLSGGRNAASVSEWSGRVDPGKEIPLVAVLVRADEWTRGPFATALKQAKLAPRSAPAAQPSEPPRIPEVPAPLEFVQQLAGLRSLHEALATQPSSPSILAALAREYVLLGSTTEVHWGIEHKVFKARALVYSERAFRAGPKAADVAWTRALVRMLCGLPQLAGEEVKRATDLKGDAPAWSESLAAAVRWDGEGLADLAEQDKPLAAYLDMRRTELVGSLDQRMAATNRVIERQPECFRAVAALANEDPLGLRRSLGGPQLRQFGLSLPRLLREVSGMPEAFTKELADREKAAGEELSPERYGAFLKQLRGLDADADQREPSLDVLATLAENLAFVHVHQIVSTHNAWLGLDGGEALEPLRPILDAIPYGEIAGVYRRDTPPSAAAFKKVAPALFTLPISEAAFPYVARMGSLPGNDLQRFCDAIRDQRDDLVPELLTTLEDTYSDAEKAPKAAILRRLAPDSPAAIAATIRYEWPVIASQGAGLVESSESVKVLQALAERYEKLEPEGEANRTLAERAFVRMTEVDNSFESSNALASYYWRHENQERWKEVTIAALALPSYGLEDSLACSRLADWMMDRGEWNEAKPYAVRAAESYATAGLQSAARCMEGLEEWQAAERLYRAKSHRYGSSWLDWYFFCRRSGQGDLAAASEYCRENLATLSDWQKAHPTLAFYYQLEGEPEKALALHQKLHKEKEKDKDEAGYAALCAIVLLDELKQTKARDELVNTLLNANETHIYGMLCDQISRPVPAGGKPFSETDLELCFAYSRSGNDATNTAYFIGKLLLNRGERDRAVTWLQRAAGAPRTQVWTCTLASAELIRLGVPIAPRRKSPLSDELVDVVAREEAIVEVWKPESIQKASALADEAIKAYPESGGLRLMAASIARDAGDLPRADTLYTEALKRLPGNPFVLSNRGKIREFLGREAEAIEDYEAALKTSPRYQMANINLGWIRASSANPQFRDGKAALRHARTVVEVGPGASDVGIALLAAANAESGKFDEAVKLVKRAIANGIYPDKERLNNWVKSYQAKKPHRRPPSGPPR